MVCLLFEFVKSYLNGNIEPKVFSEAYLELYRISKDNDLLPKDVPYLRGCLFFLGEAAMNHCVARWRPLLSDKELFVYVKTELERFDVCKKYGLKSMNQKVKTTFL